jgi:RNA polymerase sigma factor (sigma-70 family)
MFNDRSQFEALAARQDEALDSALPPFDAQDADADADDFAVELASVSSARSQSLIEVNPERVDFTNLMTLYLRDVRRYRPLDAKAEAALLAGFGMEGDAQARSELICHHLGLVIAMARKFNNRGLDLLDLIEEGNLGMLVALQKFDPLRGLRFSTYAAWWIRYYLQTAIATQVPIVRPPLRAQRRAGKEAWGQWCASHDVASVTAQGAVNHDAQDASPNDMGINDDSYGHLDSMHSTAAEAPRSAPPREAAPLVTPLAIHDSDIEAHFAAANICHPDVVFEVAEHLDAPRLSALLRRLVASLPPRQRDVVTARFGLDGQDECTLQDLGAEQGVSRERMRQVQASALQALRDGLERAGVDRAGALS